MSIRSTMLRPVAFLAGLHASSQAREFMETHQRTRQAQQELLQRFLQVHANSDFGRDHSFAKLRSYEDFRAAVPVRQYEAMAPYMEKVLAGETRALLPPGEEVLMFSMTSGSTGRPKHIPVTRRFLADMRRGWNTFGIAALRDHSEAWLRPIVQVSSPMSETQSPTGLPCGAISGLLAQTQKKIVKRMYAVPPEVFAITDPTARYYTILRFAIERDIAFIATANPSSTIKLIETGQAHAQSLVRDIINGTLSGPATGYVGGIKARFRPNHSLGRRLQEGIARDGKLLPRHFWKISFLANWTGGTLGLYLPRLRELFDGAPVRDIGLLASEGRFSIPLSDHTSAGVADITSNFLEFIPAHKYAPADRNLPTLLADQLEVGQEYFLVITNWTGLCRYSMDDRVRVVGHCGYSPVFEFLCRGLRTANITGEKITEEQVVHAMRQALGQTGRAVERFVMQGRFSATPYYELRLESQTGLDAAALAAALDGELGKLNMEYQSKRHSGRLGPIKALVLPPDELARAESENISRRNGRSEQYKHQYLIPAVLSEQPGV